MLNLKHIRENKDDVVQRLKVKNFDAGEIIEKVIATDEKRRTTQNRLDQSLAESKALAKEIGMLFKTKQIDQANKAKERSATLKEESKTLNQQLQNHETELHALLLQIPNLPHHSVPHGKGADDNEEIRSGGSMPQLESNALPHWDLASKYQLIDFELGNKITGSGFPFYRRQGAKLQRALIAYFLDEAIKAGYEEFIPPLIVNEATGYGTGQLPDKEGQMYHVQTDNFYLIPTAEVPLTNMFRDVILNASDFPVKSTAYTPCFRREAGSYGKDVRGLNRLHQFDKVEIVEIQHPKDSYATLDKMVAHVEMLVQQLELPYRILKLCGGDMSFTAALTFDFEVYAAAQKKWLEVSSVSNFEDYQANRMKLRFKDNNEKGTQAAHTLNGSALALPRIVAALLENNQTAEGIRIPKVLQPYTGFEIIR